MTMPLQSDTTPLIILQQVTKTYQTPTGDFDALKEYQRRF